MFTQPFPTPLDVAEGAGECGHGLGPAVGDHEEHTRLVHTHERTVADEEAATLQLHHLSHTIPHSGAYQPQSLHPRSGPAQLTYFTLLEVAQVGVADSTRLSAIAKSQSDCQRIHKVREPVCSY